METLPRPTAIALIVAAGTGTRMGGDMPKQYAMLRGRSVLAHAVDAFVAHPRIAAVRVVIGAGQADAYADAIGARSLPPPVIGGATRRASVAAGLAAIDDADHVLIHDAARPFVPADVIDRLLDALDEAAGAVPVLAVADTLARVDGAGLADTVSRTDVVRVQTPQAFHLAAIRAAHAAWDLAVEATDDAQMLRAVGGHVAVVTGDARLDKLTVPADLAAAMAMPSLMPSPMTVRVGSGFDVHVFGPGDHVWIGGIAIPHGQALVGHSDADVLLHAITDALLGAIGDGDIGQHFPPSDPRWRGASSDRFLDHARERMLARGGVIDHVDATVICEAPRIGPHRAAIRTRIAAILRLSETRISVKATTTERLGFTGRGEGIAAQATVTVRLPETD